jgi:hypothetical protein
MQHETDAGRLQRELGFGLVAAEGCVWSHRLLGMARMTRTILDSLARLAR